MRTLSALLLLSAPLLAADLTATKSKEEVTFKEGDKVVAKYVFGGDIPKPHFWPVHAPDGTLVTATSPGNHKHHKSIWFCHGDVIPEGIELKTKSSDTRVHGVDFWSEAKGHGKIVCVEVGEPKAENGVVTLPTKNEWRTPDGDKILDETRVLTVRKAGSGYLIGFDIDLHASVCELKFGDTKEGAFGTRMSEEITTEKKLNDTLTADGGRKGEKAIWGHPVSWMDSSGKVDGKEVGLAVFDHPKNPVRAISHGRAYGLMAANPFGREKSFPPSQKGKTDLVGMKKGDHLKLKYAAYVHTGDAKSGGVEEAYKLFSEGK
jgi:Methane oxygenase PmoA